MILEIWLFITLRECWKKTSARDIISELSFVKVFETANLLHQARLTLYEDSRKLKDFVYFCVICCDDVIFCFVLETGDFRRFCGLKLLTRNKVHSRLPSFNYQEAVCV